MAVQNQFLSISEWSAQTGRVPSLDGIRAISVIIVLTGHILLPSRFVGVSALGLKIFFFVSGFLITRLLLAESKVSFISLPIFYVRRILRLYPVIVVYTLVVAIVALQRDVHVRIVDVISVFLYFVNYQVIHYLHTGGEMSLPIGMMWSLSIEEHFYLLAPICIALLRGNALKIIAVAFAVCVLSLALRLFYAYINPHMVETLELYWRSETRFDCIAYGVLLACMTEIPAGRKIIALLATRGAFLAGLILLLLSFAYRDNYFQNTWRFSIQGFALFPLLASVIFAQPFPLINRALNAKIMAWIGALSYSLYIWHGGIEFMFESQLLKLPPYIMSTAQLMLAFIFACISYYLVEKPALRLKKYIGGRSGSANVPNPVVATAKPSVMSPSIADGKP